MAKIDFCDSNERIIEIYYNNDFMDIDKEKLYQFVVENNLHYWVDNFYDPKESDGHGEQTGYHSFEEYFNLPFENIEDDILLYIKQKNND
jgi:hypothetical protein